MTGTAREGKVIRGKYEQVKKIVRRKVAELNQEKRGTGGGPPKAITLTVADEKIADTSIYMEIVPSCLRSVRMRQLTPPGGG